VVRWRRIEAGCHALIHVDTGCRVVFRIDTDEAACEAFSDNGKWR
jgi:hypothetical protein